MDKIKGFFDDFTFHARVMPIIILSIPIVIIGIHSGIAHDSLIESVLMCSITLAFLTITSNIARNLGKDYEKKMYKQLGGMPTTIVQRFSDDTFDDITKQRYHKKLNQFEGLNLPLDRATETINDDQQYISAANILRNYANANREKEPRVYQELKEYNFWRNMYGTKNIALFLYFCILVREIVILYINRKLSLKEIFLQPYPEYLTLIVTAIGIILMLFFINQKTVEQKGFDYAKTLIEVCERVPVNICNNDRN